MKHKNLKLLIGSLLLSLSLLFGGCSEAQPAGNTSYDLESVPEYNGDAYVTIHDNVPFSQTMNLQPMPLKIIVIWMILADAELLTRMSARKLCPLKSAAKSEWSSLPDGTQ